MPKTSGKLLTTLHLQGQAAAPGTALGSARLCLPPAPLGQGKKTIPAHTVEAELQRLQQAICAARAEMRQLSQRLQGALPLPAGEFIDLHALLLDDPELIAALQMLIREQHYSASYALRVQRDLLAQVFDGMEDAYLRARLDDLDHVIARIHAFLQPQTVLPKTKSQAGSGEIWVCHTISPTELLQLPKQGVMGVISATGSHLSHVAILARHLRLPLIVGVGEALHQIQGGDSLIINGNSGTVLCRPSALQLRQYQQQKRQHLPVLAEDASCQPARTLDGVEIILRANAEQTEEITRAQRLGAQGLGLYRSEFLFLQSAQLPDEEAQFCAYREAVLAMPNQPVTIRTLDLGADKADSFGLAAQDEANPALGLRGLRLTLAHPHVADSQLRAILRASEFGQIRILLPMVSERAEIIALKRRLQRQRRALRQEGCPLAASIPLGVMIEIPAAALAIDTFIDQVDFLALGSNDLMQYVLAADRNNAAVAHLYSRLHPGLLRLLAQVIHGAAHYAKPLYVCGEMASNPYWVPLLLALGLTELSLHPAHLLSIQRRICACHFANLQKQAEKLLQARDGRAIERWLAHNTPPELSQAPSR